MWWTAATPATEASVSDSRIFMWKGSVRDAEALNRILRGGVSTRRAAPRGGLAARPALPPRYPGSPRPVGSGRTSSRGTR
jgi:hypothetical protein